VQDLGRGRIVRLGTYGDPAAIPSSIWDRLISRAESIWHTRISQDFVQILQCKAQTQKRKRSHIGTTVGGRSESLLT